MAGSFTDVSQKRIPVADIELGMFVSKLDRRWEDTPFIFQGFQVVHNDEIDQLRQTCDHVYIDVKQTIDIKNQKHATAATRKKRYIDTISFEQEMPTAVSAYKRTKEQLDSVLSSLRMGHDLDEHKVQSLVKECVESVIRNSSALTWLTQIKQKDDYTAEHSLRVAIMAIAFGRDLELLEGELETLGICGLLHDVGKVKVPLSVLNKQQRLTQQEFLLMRSHPEEGRKLLMSKSQALSKAVDVAYTHHERIDGKGYPRGITSEKIPYFAKIVAIVDAFDAITSDRCYRNGRSSLEGLRIIYDDRGKHFDRELSEKFVRFVGVYPPGHIAELNTGHAGIILSCSGDSKLRPKLLIVRDKHKKPCPEKVFDLGFQDRLPDGTPVHVREVHADGTFGIDLKFYRDKGLRIWEEPVLFRPEATV